MQNEISEMNSLSRLKQSVREDFIKAGVCAQLASKKSGNSVIYPKTAKAVKTARIRIGLDQKQFAQKLRVSRTTLSSWECGYNIPPYHTYVWMREYLPSDAAAMLDINEFEQEAGTFEDRFNISHSTKDHRAA